MSVYQTIIKEKLECGGLFKLICGAGNEDIEETYKLSYIYTIAGADIIDVAATPEIIHAANKGIMDAYQFMQKNDKTCKKYPDKMRPVIMISVGVNDDPHTRKASINKHKCYNSNCDGECKDVCPQNAIDLIDVNINTSKCIGCGKCYTVCKDYAITFTHISKTNASNLINCKRAGADMIELHASATDKSHIISELEEINHIFTQNYISLCVNREQLNDNELCEVIKNAYTLIGNRLIIQADGIPMSGGENTFNSTLQAVATADIINKKINIKLPVFISGGTNAKSAGFARQCGVNIVGVAIGSYAREIIKPDFKQTGINGNELTDIDKARMLILHSYMGVTYDQS